MERLTEVFQLLNTSMNTQSDQEGGESSNMHSNASVKLEFPLFNGREGPTSSLCRAEQFLQYHGTPEEERVMLASFHLEGEAQLWFQHLQQESRDLQWKEPIEGLFGALDLHNFSTCSEN